MTITLDTRADIALDICYRVAWLGEGVRFSAGALSRMAACREAFLGLLDDPEIVIYGVTSGYGHRAHLRFTPAERQEHAQRKHLAPATSFGEPLPKRVTRAMVLARLTNFIEGHAAITPSLAEAVAAMLAGRDLPPVPGLGNGCAGEIQALTSLFTPLMQAHDLGEKDGLSLINGSPCAVALNADAVLAARARLDLATEVFALSIEAFLAPLEAYDPALAQLWEDRHEAEALQTLRTWLEGAENRRRPFQAPVSWRILPRVLGQARRARAQAEEAAAIGLRAVSDNPVFLAPDSDHPRGRVLSNGGFHNAMAYPVLDALGASWADLALLCDRHSTKMLDGKVSLLPDKLIVGDGYIGTLGFTAAAFAEQARRAAPRTFLPGSEGGGFAQNDVAVPTFLSWRGEAEAGRCLDGALAVLAAVSSQALYVTERTAPPRLEPLVQIVRDIVPPVRYMRPLGAEIEALQRHFTAKVFAGSEAGIAAAQEP